MAERRYLKLKVKDLRKQSKTYISIANHLILGL